MPELRKVSGETAVKVLCNKMGFEVARQKGSHVVLTKMTPEGKVGTVVPMHNELKIGTLRRVLKLAKIDVEEFSEYL